MNTQASTKSDRAIVKIIVAVVIALAVGGSAPWWWKIIFPPPVSPGSPYMGELQFNTNLQGHDAYNLGKKGAAGECALECLKMEQCKAMTFVEVPSEGGGICWLKNSVPEKSTANGMVSAVKIFPSLKGRRDSQPK